MVNREIRQKADAFLRDKTPLTNEQELRDTVSVLALFIHDLIEAGEMLLAVSIAHHIHDRIQN